MDNFSSNSSNSSNNTGSNVYPSYSLFGYEPSFGLSLTALIAFSVVSFIITVLSIKFKKYYFLVGPLAGVIEAIGYGFRIKSAEEPTKLIPYILSTLFILLPPTIMAAVFLFSQLGKIMKKTGISHPFFKPNVVKYLFLGVDCFSILIQSSGGGLLSQGATNPGLADTGKAVILLGLAIALASFTVFFFLVLYLHIQVRKIEEEDKSWRKIFIAMYLSGIFIVLRSIYRVAEYVGGYHSSIMLNERLFYGLDTIPIFLLMVIWVPFHPGFVRLSSKGYYLLNNGASTV